MKKLLLDTNVLVLYLAGHFLTDPFVWKRLSDFDVDDLKRVKSAAKSATMVTLPNILTEASNLLGSGKQQGFKGAAKVLAWFAGSAEEVFVKSSEVVDNTAYSSLGLTDTAIYALADQNIQVLTIDFELADRLAGKGVSVENLRHFKTPRSRNPSR